MKRVYLILTLFMTSFFLLSSNVSADTRSLPLSDSQLNIIASDNFARVREEAIRYSSEKNLYYVIYYSGNPMAYFFDSADDITNLFRFDSPTSTLYYLIDLHYNSYFTYFSGANRFSYTNYSGSYQFYTGFRDNYSLDVFVDTNYPDLIFTGSDTFNLSSGNCSYTLTNGDKFRTLYDYYQANQNDCKFPGEEEEIKPNLNLELVTNFYTLSIDKIKYLADVIATNHIILFALVIFIFVAIIGLVRGSK